MADQRISSLEQIDINQWTLFGGGGNGQSYYHVTDEDLMLKLYSVSASYKDVEAEFVVRRTL